MTRPIRIRSRPGFTLTELLVVIAVIGLLMGLLLPVLSQSRRHARITQCVSQMRQMFDGIELYDQSHDNYRQNFPPHLTTMYQEGYIKDGRVFQCPLDANAGREGGKPPVCTGQFATTDEGPGVNGLPPNTPYSSYMYEFNSTKCDWWNGWVEYYDGSTGGFFYPSVPGDPSKDGDVIDTNVDGTTTYVSWQETKFYQLKYGDIYLHTTGAYTGGYPDTYFPVVRCFWHAAHPDTETPVKEIKNLVAGGNVFDSTPQWENTAMEHLDN
ncbi:MAG: prepilin-type N-terminal cleavage/methylation domain-containing protein [Planctomycetota bacterium]|nr:prepilin-type N-terminal cleavage/methylation domain-containing protein [Planctomycetota bacterium]